MYNKWTFTKEVNKRFASRRAATVAKKPKKFERSFALLPDTALTIKHNLRTRKVKVKATTSDGKPFAVKTEVVDPNTIKVLDRGTTMLKFTIEENLKDEKTFWRNAAEYAMRLVMSPRTAALRFRDTRSLSLPLFRPDIGNIFGQTNSYGPMAPGLDFAFGFFGSDYVERAKQRGWLITDDGQTSPAVWSRARELNIELTLEPVRGLKIQLTTNRTDNRNEQMQFMYDNVAPTLSGSFTKTHIAIATALGSSSAGDGYYSKAFSNFIDYIPVIADRVEQQYHGVNYPTGGFMNGNAHAGNPFNPEVGTISATSSDVLIPAFIAAYSGTSPGKQYLSPFPSFAHALPNWRVTYDGLIQLGNLSNIFKSFTLTHAYQCTYSVGSYSSYLNWISADGSNLGFTLDELTGNPVPSSPYNISSVAITEKFAPLIGAAITFKNELTLSAEYRDSRTLTLNTSAGQVVEATTRGLTVGAGYKIVGFNTFLKMKGSGVGVSNDLTINADFSLQHTQALIRRIESNYSQPTSGTRTMNMNISANYVMSRRITMGMFFDHQVNTPIVSTSTYPTTNTSFGITLNLSLAR
ncbi:MAG: cell surface protein SprA [Duncaniella sp.]|nr:cell surface protein SprA [Duncaniella sp.]